MKRTLYIMALMGLVSCSPNAENAQPTAAAEPEGLKALMVQAPTPRAKAPAPVDEKGLCALNPPPVTWDTPRELTTLEIATGEDNLEGFIAALAGRPPTQNLLMDALTQGSERIITWLCEEQGMRLTQLDKLPWSAVPQPDSPEFPFPELDEDALAGLRLLFKAGPELVKDDVLMANCFRCYSAYRYPKTLRYLLSQGVNPNGRDAEGRTPLDYAYYFQWQEGIRILREHGATERTPGRTFEQKQALFDNHRCAKDSAPEPESNTIPVSDTPFYIWKDPGADGPDGGIICRECGATE